MARLQLTSDPAADTLLSEEPFALLVGMLLDQQIAMEVAFAGPRKIADRLGGIDARLIADADPERFAAACAQTPAVHRFPGSMAKRIQDLACEIVARYDGDTVGLWTTDDPDGAEVLRRLKALPGFGEQKAKIFLALLGKQYGVTPRGWRAAAGDYGKAGTHMSIADVVDKGSLDQVRAYKKKMKAARAEAATT
ncbi:MAG: HhH-GPD-type base excision DNA repair protein [Mycobacterium sp.]